jgi:hypothetical protein
MTGGFVMSRQVSALGLASSAPSRRRSRALAAAVLFAALALTLGACGQGSGGDSTQHPTGKNEIVLQVSSGGGFVTVAYNLTQLPQFTLYGDGTVIVTGPMIEIYPGPAMPNLQTTHISEDAIQEILSAAKEAGLFATGVDYGQPGITDIPTTNIVVSADGKTYTTDIYALGMESGAGGLSLEQQQARAAISELVGKLGVLTDYEPGELKWEPYAYTALKVFSLAVDPSTSPDPNDVQPNELVWPLGDLSTLGESVMPEGYRAVVVSGTDLATLQPLLAQATEITLWTSGARQYNLFFRPLLPNETP